MNRLLTTLWLSFIVLSLDANPSTLLSDQSQISILTCDPGNELYSLFGHSAIRVYDIANDLDIVYNYGTFDFDEPNFAIKFLRGKLLYQLGKTTTSYFLREYHYYERSVYEQVIDLSLEKRQSVYEFLQENALPENAKYKYDFYFDNCTTRLLEIVESNIPNIVYPVVPDTTKTFRNLLHENLQNHPWTRFGMDIILGEMNDDVASFKNQMFLPYYLFENLKNAKLNEQENLSDQNVVKRETVILSFTDSPGSKSLLTPSNVFWSLFVFEMILFILVYISGDPKYVEIYDKLWFFLLFVAFLVFAFMWFLTDHEVCERNWNMMWTTPWMVSFCLLRRQRPLLKYMFSLTLICSLFLLLCWSHLPQYLHEALIPLVLINMVKSSRLVGINKWLDRVFFKPAIFLICCLCLPECMFSQEKIDGITLVAPPREFSYDPMPQLTEVNADWVALVPYAFSRKEAPMVRFGTSRQWWGERKEGIEESIKLARKNGLKVMLKPQVYIPGGWVGEVDYQSEEDWRIWENSYRDYILSFVELAAKYEIEIFCVGTEYRISVVKREKFWRELIKEIRGLYKGKLVYSANWDSYNKVPFWSDLDYIGLSSYFPLTDMKTPSPFYLNLKWNKIISKLRRYSSKHGKKILFTEFGYLAVDGAAGKTWELETQARDLPENQEAQANAYTALFKAFWNQEFWAGGFLWKWFPGSRFPSHDYTPQGKIASEVVALWYKKS